MMRWEKTAWAPDAKGFPLPGEGPSADRLAGSQPAMEEDTGSEHVVLNQDGSMLGGGAGHSVVNNPTGGGIGDIRRGGQFVHAEPDHLTIGSEDDTVLPDDGERRTYHGMSGDSGDLGHSGFPGGDPSNIGVEGDNMYGE